MFVLIAAVLWGAHAEEVVPAYDTRRYKAVLEADQSPRALRRSLRALLREHGITHVATIPAGGQAASGLRSLSPAAGRALLSSMTDTRPGTDLDVLVKPLGSEDRIPVSVTWDGASVTVEEGPRWDGARPTMARDAFQRRWDLRLESDGTAEWGEVDLGLLHMALSKLSATELAQVRGLPFRRVGQPPTTHNGGPASAAYTFSIDGAQLLFYNLDSDAQRTIFCGTPDAPMPMEVWTILHELGHAIGWASVHQPALAVLPLVRRVARLYEQLEQPGLPDRSEVGAAYFAALMALEAAGFTSEGWNAYQEQLHAPSAEERALQALLADRRPVTWYAATAPREAFAELFALWHIEPAQLRRHAPEAADWFAAGAHLWAAPTP